MGIEFDTAEQALIDQQSVPDNLLPLYYVPDTDSEYQISTDFESYLILQPASQKQAILAWMQYLQDLELVSIDRDTILTLYLNLRANNAATVISDIEGVTGNFDDFKANLVFDDRFQNLVELNLVSRAMQRPMDEIIIQQELAFHEQNMALLIQSALDSQAFSTQTAQELSNWQIVFGTFKGQSQ